MCFNFLALGIKLVFQNLQYSYTLGILLALDYNGMHVYYIKIKIQF